MQCILLLSVTALWGTWTGASEEPVGAEDVRAVATFNQSYQRTHSRVMMRLVRQPTRAQLDFAAYDRNIFFHVPKPEPVTAPSPQPKLADLHFGGALVPGSLRDRLAQTPLTDEEKQQPLAVTPLLDYLAVWNFEAAEKLLRCAAQVSGEKWGNQDYPRPLQRMATAYLHQGEGGAMELWAKVEFEPVVTFLEGVTDEDGDGYPEIYGQVDPEAITVPLLEQIRRDYLARRLTPEEVETYFFELSSAWYRALQTVALEPQERCPWPNPETEPEVRQEIGDLVLQQPTAVIRGKPFGRALYNVFLVADSTALPPQGEEGERRGRKGKEGEGRGPDSIFHSPFSIFHSPADCIRHELQQWGQGRWETWEERLAGFRQDVRRLLASQPEEVKGLVGRDGFLFFRGSLEYLLAGDLRQQPDGRDPFPAIVDYHQQLQAKGIDMLLVIIPAKPEVFPEKVSAQAPPGGKPYVTPYTRKLLLELAEAGVESVDLLPAFLEARDLPQPPLAKGGSEGGYPPLQGGEQEPFYMPLDTHWSHRALRLAAHLIAERVKQYPWFPEVCPQPIPYRTKEVPTVRAGDIRGMLPESEKVKYRPMTLTAQQVLKPDGSFYEDDPNSPIVLLGDSFCGVFHFEDCQHAGLSAHLARELGLPIDLIMAHGSGPRIRGQLARRGAEAIRRKKLVIWTVAARDLYHYWAPWEKVRVP